MENILWIFKRPFLIDIEIQNIYYETGIILKKYVYVGKNKNDLFILLLL